MKKGFFDTVVWFMLLLTAFIAIFPIFWGLTTSLKPKEEILLRNYAPFPRNPTLKHYFDLFKREPFGLFIANSFIVSVVATLFALITSTASGFVFAKYDFPLKNLLFIIILATIMIPIQVYGIPLYLLMNNIGWINTLQGLIVPGIIMSMGIFFMKQNIEMIPDSLLDSARIDGCSEFGIFLRIIVPLSRAPIMAISIISFTVVWNWFFWPLIIATSKNVYTLNIGLTLFQRQYMTEHALQMAGAFIGLLPPLVFFLIFRRYILEGIALSGIKA